MLLIVLQGFYDPVKEEFIEPARTGISYSFTEDGHYEEAYYRAISNRTSMSRYQAMCMPNSRQRKIRHVLVASCNGSTAHTPFGQTTP